jgi:hypothetical protein
MNLDSSLGRPTGIVWSVGRREGELNGRDCPNIRQREDMWSAGSDPARFLNPDATDARTFSAL